jgi:hypothetical protein
MGSSSSNSKKTGQISKNKNVDITNITDFSEFNLTIDNTNNAAFRVCLSYVGDNEEIKRKLYEKKIDCLFVLSIGTVARIINSRYYIGDNEDKITIENKSDSHIGMFYNKTLSDKDIHNFFSKKLKGIGHVILCKIIDYFLEKDILNMDSIVSLQASGEIKGKSMHGLINYYESLGFKQTVPELLDLFISQENVPMTGKVKDIIRKCSGTVISDKLRELDKISLIR